MEVILMITLARKGGDIVQQRLVPLSLQFSLRILYVIYERKLVKKESSLLSTQLSGDMSLTQPSPRCSPALQRSLLARWSNATAAQLLAVRAMCTPAEHRGRGEESFLRCVADYILNKTN